jgi:transcriptional regulator with XRE-family HTH domain
MDKFWNVIHARVGLLCDSKGWTQADLAHAMKITPQGLTQIMKHGHPSLRTLERMAKALGVEVNRLLDAPSNKEIGAAAMRR